MSLAPIRLERTERGHYALHDTTALAHFSKREPGKAKETERAIPGFLQHLPGPEARLSANWVWAKLTPGEMPTASRLVAPPCEKSQIPAGRTEDRSGG